MKKIVVGRLFSLSLLLAACGGGENSDSGSSTDQLDPKNIVMGKCSSCHGGNLEGSGSTPALNEVGAHKSYEEILDVIENGQGRMPGGMIEGEQAEMVAQWLSEKK